MKGPLWAADAMPVAADCRVVRERVVPTPPGGVLRFQLPEPEVGVCY